MNLSNQIKSHRKRLGLSQVELAERLYVSSQTISNWENERSYPDIHNLIALSILFDTSLDQLVKGDIEEMKKSNEASVMNRYSLLMLIFLFLAVVSLGPVIKFLGEWGLLISVILWGIGMYYAIKIDRIKSKYNIKTINEIEQFMKDGKLNDKPRNEMKSRIELIKIVAIVVIIGAAIAFISLKLFSI